MRVSPLQSGDYVIRAELSRSFSSSYLARVALHFADRGLALLTKGASGFDQLDTDRHVLTKRMRELWRNRHDNPRWDARRALHRWYHQ